MFKLVLHTLAGFSGGYGSSMNNHSTFMILILLSDYNPAHCHHHNFSSEPIMTNTLLPYFASGTIVKGFGRGSKALGIPTANYPENVIEKLPKEFDNGIYYGWAKFEGEVYKMVMCVGWNPFYKNKKKSMEVHMLHKFNEDLHGKELKVIVTGFIRPERDFPSIEALIAEMENDIAIASKSLDELKMTEYKSHEFFKNQKT